ncbi:hypothetical protein [Frankia sp. ACN10a]|nr:hypothetical protein [Frankia sp. ACN10a]
MSDPATRKATAAAWRAIASRSRREAVQLAGRGRRHPDQTVAEAADGWARMILRPVWWNRVPAWTLTAFGLVLAAGAVLLSDPVLAVGAFVVLACGCLGWLTHRAASRILAASADTAA